MDMTSSRLDADDTGELEVELKLTTNPRSLSKLLNLLSKSDAVDRTSRKTARLISTYYDTEDRRLRDRGLTLRVRQKAGQYVQTVKSEGGSASGMFTRTEWSSPLDGKTPNLEAVTAAKVRGRMGLVRQEELTPLFRTDVKRTTLIVQHTRSPGDTATVELAFDQGRIIAGKKTDKICEVELELVQGTRTALVDLAQTVSKQIPTVLNLGSKVSRGFDLCDGTHPLGNSAGKIALSKRYSIEQAIVEILRPSLGQLLTNRNAAVVGKDIEGVHQARVAIRRLLSAMVLFKKYLTGPQRKHIKSELRWLIDTLGEARDLDVFIDEVLGAVVKDRPKDTDLSALMRVAKKARTQSYKILRTALSSRRYTAAMLEISSWIEDRSWRAQVPQDRLNAPIKSVAGSFMSKSHRKVLATGKDFAILPPVERHSVRIALKKMRYAAEFFTGLYPANKTLPYIAKLRHLQTALGAANDVANAESLCSELLQTVKRGTKEADAVRSGIGKVLGWHTRAATDANDDVETLWKTFTQSKPFWLAK